jgi:hypothetical protein
MSTLLMKTDAVQELQPGSSDAVVASGSFIDRLVGKSALMRDDSMRRSACRNNQLLSGASPMETVSLAEELLQSAVAAVYAHDSQLFKERVHERSIVFHIARRLADAVDAQMPGWFVDVEYDRWHVEDLGNVKKRMLTARLESPDADVLTPPGADRDEDDFSDVYPDVIIHDRAGLGAAHNLLAVEVKKEERRGHGKDIAKLRGFLDDPFCYQHAVFVILPRDGSMPRCMPID